MNSFIDKVKRWFKKSSFGIILTSIAIVLTMVLTFLVGEFIYNLTTMFIN